MAGTRRIQARVYGQVQGVGYRYFVQRVARALKLTGYVRNEGDGSVLVEAQGAEAALTEMLRELQFGPSAASVEKVKTDWLEPARSEGVFTIRF